MKHTTCIILVLLSFCLAAVSPAQDLFEKTEGQKIAERINSSQVELIRHLEAQLNNFYQSVNTPGKQQEILDAFGTKAAVALQRYVAMRNAIIAIKPDSTVPEPDLTVFVPNADGTVTYVAPPVVETPVVE